MSNKPGVRVSSCGELTGKTRAKQVHFLLLFCTEPRRPYLLLTHHFHIDALPVVTYGVMWSVNSPSRQRGFIFVLLVNILREQRPATRDFTRITPCVKTHISQLPHLRLFLCISFSCTSARVIFLFIYAAKQQSYRPNLTAFLLLYSPLHSASKRLTICF